MRQRSVKVVAFSALSFSGFLTVRPFEQFCVHVDLFCPIRARLRQLGTPSRPSVAHRVLGLSFLHSRLRFALPSPSLSVLASSLCVFLPIGSEPRLIRVFSLLSNSAGPEAWKSSSVFSL